MFHKCGPKFITCCMKLEPIIKYFSSWAQIINIWLVGPNIHLYLLAFFVHMQTPPNSSLGESDIHTFCFMVARNPFRVTRNGPIWTKKTPTTVKSLSEAWKCLQTADHLSLRVFRVRQKQNILGLSTQRDLFKSAMVYWWKTLFKKVFLSFC